VFAFNKHARFIKEKELVRLFLLQKRNVVFAILQMQ